jgi:hypothetical protein
MSAIPDYNNIKWSNLQKKNRMRFRDAMAWARKTLNDPEKQAYYRNKAKSGQTVWNVAVADYMKKPGIAEIDVSRYKGQKGNVIHIRAQDNYRLATLMITIINALGIEVESILVPNPTSYIDFHYTTTEQNLHWQGGRVVVRVTDSPGNTVQTFRVL